MKLSSVHHIAIIVSDIEKAREFYVEKLGFEAVRENYRKERDDWKLDLRVGEHTELEIFCREESAKACKPTGSLRLATSGFPSGKCRRSSEGTGRDGNRV